MELDKDIINIATGDPELVRKTVDRFNKVYKADFEYIGSEDRDGVEFAMVKRGKSTLDQVYLLGFFKVVQFKNYETKNKLIGKQSLH